MKLVSKVLMAIIILLIGCLIMIFIDVEGYTAPENNAVELFLDRVYSAPENNAVNLVLSDQAPIGESSLNLSFGPSGATIFRFATCGPSFENSSAEPQLQNSSHGIDYICNNGTAIGNVCVYLSGAINTNWTMYASNTSISSNLIELNTTCKQIYNELAIDSCTYIWYKANCSYVNQGPGVYEIYNVTNS